ncbi:ankyrin repeat protein [Cordyceps javanica]|uniref:Ankyrin repeat protein n=1 Tax=Cordyceps javanica TaxID=43265 RepID=A0A545VUN0_9HYPO|nr:ankyrin repeat protein [Cordyceps javanica]TQW05429.1 ankyrin repeat protein [Cordyceps javanica]
MTSPSKVAPLLSLQPADLKSRPESHSRATADLTWSKACSRKLSTLYLYTNLPLAQICAVIDSWHPRSEQTGIDSASRHINILLGKESRWLRPKSIEDMGCRLEQLPLSCARMKGQDFEAKEVEFASCNGAQPSHQPTRVIQNPTAEHEVPNTRAIRAMDSAKIMCYDSESFQPLHHSEPRGEHESCVFEKFLQRLVDDPLYSKDKKLQIDQTLYGYSSAYQGVVQGLLSQVNRIATEHLDASQTLTSLELSSSTISRSGNQQMTVKSSDGKVLHLPGDYLCFDSPAQHLECDSSGYHVEQHGMFSFASRLFQPPLNYPWLHSNGLKEHGSQILEGLIHLPDFSEMDSFGNTIMHFVAARGDISQVYDLILRYRSNETLLKINSAGQSFLHVMNDDSTAQSALLVILLQTLTGANVDIFTRDLYGRNFFHILQENTANQIILDTVLPAHDIEIWNLRDAFGEKPRLTNKQTARKQTAGILHHDDALEKDEESLFMNYIGLWNLIHTALYNPTAEDSHGRNALHCLAVVKIETQETPARAEASQSVGLPSGNENGHRSRSGLVKTQSSRTIMEHRSEVLGSLLDVGVSPNSYDENGQTPLMAFIVHLPEDDDYRSGPEMLDMLIKGGADLEARNRNGETALHVAVRCGRKLAVRTLVLAGANIRVTDIWGRSLLDVADAQIDAAAKDDRLEACARVEACRAWLSSDRVGARQNPCVVEQWILGVD